jgi:uncharacterized membrane protein YdjX (TVP38/TMEM64 family)
MHPAVKSPRTLLPPILLLAVVLSAIFLPIDQIMTGIQNWAEVNQSSAVFIVTVSIILGTLLLLPVSLMTMLAGFLFGLAQGFFVVWIASLVASTAAFWIGRSFARPWIEHKIHRKTTFVAIDRAIRRKGFLVVLLTRLVMVLPYPALNYSLGLTSVSPRDYLLATNIGGVPPFFLFVYLGTTVSDIAAIINGDVRLEGNEMLLGLTALFVVVGLVLLIVRVAGKTLKEELLAARK